VGQVIRPWGTRGQVKIEVLTDFPQRFRPGVRLLIDDRSYLCEAVTRPPKSLVLKLQGVESPEQAEELRSALLEVPTAEAEPLPEGSYYYYQVLGLEVYTTDGDHLGQVAEILPTGSNDVYVVQGPRGEVLIPATAEVITALDLKAGRITIEPLPGLL
jgi:16S rRNA processing protein RimM